VVKVTESTGGLTSQGSIFTYSQSNKPPVFTTAPGNVTNFEGDTLKATFVANDPDLNQTATLSLQSGPEGAAFNATTGKLTWPIGEVVTAAQVKKTFSFTIRATDNSSVHAYRDTTFVDTVYNKNQAPRFVNKLAATVTVKDSDTLKFTYTATDPDAGDVFTFSIAAGAPAGLTLNAGVLSWIPTFLQSNQSYTIKVYVTDQSGLKDSASSVITVGRKVLKGDINKDGVVGVLDASLALQNAAGIAVLTDTVQLWAGDVSGNGTVTAYDASWILRKVAGDTSVHFAPKMEAGYGSIAIDNAVSAGENVLSLPLRTIGGNITSVQFTLNYDATKATYEGVKTTLPKDWQVMTSKSDGKITVAMAGVTPVASSEIATIALRIKNQDASISVTGQGFVNETESQSLSLTNVRLLPLEYALDQNYPNPFNPTTTIKYQITQDSKVTLTIYNVQGQVVRTLVNDNVAAGFQSVTWNGTNDMGQTVATGMYMYRIQAGSFVSVKKMLMLK
jgi:hypothetical protein